MRFIFFCVLLMSGAALAQTAASGFSSEITVQVLTFDFRQSQQKLNGFINANNIVVQNRNDSKKEVDISLLLSDVSLKEFESFTDSLGTVVSKKISAVNNAEKTNDLESEIAYLKNSRKSYEDILQKVGSNSEKYAAYWSEAKALDEKVFAKERELQLLSKRKNIILARIKIDDEVSSPERTDIAFVNMPGIEYSYLQIENPKTGISSESYSGYFLKYLFTRGKSFAILGAYKSNQTVSDSLQWSEMFVIGFGQDFYSRHFGGGEKSYLNLYSGYVLGYAYISNKQGKEDMFYLAPSIGLELFKNKYVLWDSKVSYMVPFSYNKNLRGISYSTSFNFVF